MFKYLALGDSYTIGELLSYKENFPSQLVDLLQKNGLPITLEKLIAVTGWTSDELLKAIEIERPAFDYDIVSLLIGVNNQYRNYPTQDYRWQFYALLCQAILFAKSIPKNVFVLSIPDWGLTPFNVDREPKVISAEIDALNAINRDITIAMGCTYISITEFTRQHANQMHYLASDGLHYSASEYAIWANEIRQVIQAQKIL
jgi:lysophospholipase L1-like esterase